MSFLKAMPAQFLSVTITFWNRQRAANVKPSTLRRHIEFDPRLPDSDLEEIRHQVNAWADRQIVKSRWESQTIDFGYHRCILAGIRKERPNPRYNLGFATRTLSARRSNRTRQAPDMSWATFIEWMRTLDGHSVRS